MMREGRYVIDGEERWHSSFEPQWISWLPRTIVDVGSYDFGDSLRLKRAFPESDVHGIEMSQCYGKYAAFAEAHGVRTHNIAIADVDGMSGYFQAHNLNGVDAQSSILRHASEYRRYFGGIVTQEETRTPVEAMTLDTFCAKNGIESIDFLHSDVEGAEYQLFAGMRRIKPRMIFAEFLLESGWEGQKPFSDTLDLLESYGYRMAVWLPHDGLFALEAA